MNQEWSNTMEIIKSGSETEFTKLVDEWTVKNYSETENVLLFLNDQCNAALQTLNRNWKARVRPRGSYVHQTAIAGPSNFLDVDVILNGLTTSDFALEYLGAKRFHAGIWSNFVSKFGKILFSKLAAVAIDPTDNSKLLFSINNVNVELFPKVTGNDGIVYGKPKSVQFYGAETATPDLIQQNPISETQRKAILIVKKWKLVHNVNLKSYHIVNAAKQVQFKDEPTLENVSELTVNIIKYLISVYENTTHMNAKYNLIGSSSGGGSVSDSQMYKDYTRDEDRQKVLDGLRKFIGEFQLTEKQQAKEEVAEIPVVEETTVEIPVKEEVAQIQAPVETAEISVKEEVAEIQVREEVSVEVSVEIPVKEEVAEIQVKEELSVEIPVKEEVAEIKVTEKPEPTEQEIREEAYYLWEKSGKPVDRDVELWLAAKKILLHY